MGGTIISDYIVGPTSITTYRVREISRKSIRGPIFYKGNSNCTTWIFYYIITPTCRSSFNNKTNIIFESIDLFSMLRSPNLFYFNTLIEPKLH